jgi:hypothetical protein
LANGIFHTFFLFRGFCLGVTFRQCFVLSRRSGGIARDTMVQHRPLALLLLPLLCLPLSTVAAQHQAGTVNVNLTYPDDRPVGAQVRVRLIGGSGGDQVGETFTNDRGQAIFLNVAVGNYHVSVNGEGIEPKESETFQVDRAELPSPS